MKYETPLCEELFRILLLDPEISDYRLTISSQRYEGSERFLLHREGKVLEAICIRSTLLAIFEESHRLLAVIQKNPRK